MENYLDSGIVFFLFFKQSKPPTTCGARWFSFSKKGNDFVADTQIH